MTNQAKWWKLHPEKYAQYRAKRKLLHADEMRQYQREYRRKHREKRNAQQREWRKNNPGKYAVYCKTWREKHPDRAAQDTQNSAERMRKLRERDPDKARLYQRKWFHDHPDHDRRARVLNAQGSFTSEEWTALCESYGNRCAACGKSVKLTVDHIVPLSRGGTNYIENIQPLCKSCNSRKHTKTIRYAKKGATTIHEIPQVGNEIV
jgi:5-methylcytosine-specific restriction endonuclease McrA